MMASCYNEINPLVIQIAALAHQGFTDKQISEKIRFSVRTVYRYRHGDGIAPGRSYRAKRQGVIVKKSRKPIFKPLDKLIIK